MEKWKGAYPTVTVQIPIFNEKYVIERIIKKCAALDWPSDKLEIQVLDDSNDGTDEIVKDVLRELATETKVKISHLHRKNREGFKAGALKAGTEKAKGEFIAIFDADFLPDKDFLTQTIPHFLEKRIGCVQCRWGHLNFDHSLVTRLQGIGHDGHFVIEQYAKCKANHLFNFNGTSGVWRRECIIDAGGWQSDCLAEDLDLSYRAQLKGWKFKFLRDVVVPAELPVSITAFKKQQARWARGSMQAALKLIPALWRTDTSIVTTAQKIESTIHLLGYGAHLGMLFNLAFTVILFFLMPDRVFGPIQYIILCLAVGPPAVVAVSQQYLGKSNWFILRHSIVLVLLHHGLLMNNSMAVLKAFQKTSGVFERTPKFGDLEKEHKWVKTGYFEQLRVSIPLGEIMMIVALVGVMYVGLFYRVHYPTYNWFFFFTAGFIFIVGLQLQELWQSKMGGGGGKGKVSQKKKQK